MFQALALFQCHVDCLLKPQCSPCYGMQLKRKTYSYQKPLYADILATRGKYAQVNCLLKGSLFKIKGFSSGLGSGSLFSYFHYNNLKFHSTSLQLPLTSDINNNAIARVATPHPMQSTTPQIQELVEVLHSILN